MSMNLSTMAKVIKSEWEFAKIKGGSAVFFAGPPGIGKTFTVIKAVKEIAETENRPLIVFNESTDLNSIPENAIVLISINLSGMLPEDFVGLPRPGEDKSIDYYVQKWITIATQYDTVIFIDDVGNVKNPEIRTLLYDLVQFQRLANRKLKQSLIILATNTAEDNVDVEEFSSALVNRGPVYRVAFDRDDWVSNYLEPKYGSFNYANDWAERTVKRIIAVLSVLPESVSYNPPGNTETLEPWPSARSWDIILEKIALGVIDRDLLPVALAAHVGEDTTRIVLDAINTELPDPEEVIRKPEILADMSATERAMLLDELVDKLKNRGNEEIMKFIKSAFTVDKEFTASIVNKLTRALDRQKRIELLRSVIKDNELRSFIKKVAEVTA